MTRIKRIILMSLLYAALFAASFFLVSYFNGYHFMSVPAIQLILGVAALMGAVVIITLLFKRSNYSLKDMIMIEELSEEESTGAEVQKINEVAENEEQIEAEEANELSAGQTEIADEGIIHTTSIHLPDGETVIEQTEDQRPEVIQKEEEQKPLNSEIKTPVLTVAPQQPKQNLTDTQITYIKASANSYINEEGFPQLVMTNDLSREDIERRKRQYERPETLKDPSRLTSSHDEEVGDDLYVQDEREDALASLLGKIILVLSVILVLICGYYVYSRYLG
ncbi:MAG: hypothetical protein K6A14_01175 [Erysipelotrichaceae bacterium]|nr:hypothetical protein [Erysipelotrichaceae bacterium]